MQQTSIEQAVYDMVKQAATVLPPDVVEVMEKARGLEEGDSTARMALDTILENIKLANEDAAPMCQDTGWPTFFVHYPPGWSTARMRREIEAAVAKATSDNILRPNAVDPLTGKNTGTCVGVGVPTVEFIEVESDKVKIDLLLKGGGCENTSAQFKLPDGELSAGRDLDGVRKVVLKAVYDAQGRGCGPAILGIGIGGDRAHSYKLAKKQLLRKLTDTNPEEELAELEKRILTEANQLGIGPMGFGGATTVLGVKAGVAARHPACFFVSVAYFCWASRRATLVFEDEDNYRVEQ
ncbi:MAG: fumarate hydratase [Planctomycetota bacterium]|nr:fumarate hydratase [Planctomycetota bacterium]